MSFLEKKNEHKRKNLPDQNEVNNSAKTFNTHVKAMRARGGLWDLCTIASAYLRLFRIQNSVSFLTTRALTICGARFKMRFLGFWGRIMMQIDLYGDREVFNYNKMRNSLDLPI